MQLVRDQVALGPRVPGTEAHARWLEWAHARLAEAGARVEDQTFQDTVPGFGVTTLTNVRASFGPGAGDRLLVLTHWDSRPWCDRDPDTTLHARPLPGANDGGSGVAVLLMLARAYRRAPPPHGVDLLFVDGEDLGNAAHPEGFFRGSRHFARALPARYSSGVLLDMVGGRGARFPREPNSMLGAPDVVRRVWDAAARLRLGSFVDDIGPAVGDDHLALIDAGVPTADIIDLSYPEWHTSRDLPGAMGPQGMQDCFQVLARLSLAP